MVLLPQGRKILLIAASLFITTFSLVFFVASGDHGETSSQLKASVFESFFNHEKEAEAPAEALPSITLNSSGSIMSVSESFQKDFGYAAKDLISEPFFDLVTHEDLAAFAGEYASASSRGSISVNAGPYHLLSAHGTRLTLITFTPGHDSKGEKNMILTIKDISEAVTPGSAKDEAHADPKVTAPAPSTPSIHDLGEDTPAKNRIIVDRTS